MRVRSWVFVIATMVPLLVFLGILYSSLAQLAEPPVDVQEGRLVWQSQGCVECHTVFGNGGYAANDITKEYSERGEDWLSSFLQGPPLIAGGHRHPLITGKPLQQLIKFLQYIDQLPITDWPPQPLLRSPQ